MKIECSHVSKRYGPVAVLRDVNLVIESGARVALVGPNGSGKSTLMRALMGMVQYEGAIYVDGQHLGRNAIAQRASYVPQSMPQFNFTVEEMITAIRIIRGLEPGTVEHCASRLSLEIQPILLKPVKQLSGGMKQKLMLALALAPEAGLLILDEPAASLDRAAREHFYELIAEQPEEATLILSSHRLEEIRHLVTHVAWVEEGAIRYYAPVKQFPATMLQDEERDHVAA